MSVVCEIDKQFVYLEETIVIKFRFMLTEKLRKYGGNIRVKFNYQIDDQDVNYN